MKEGRHPEKGGGASLPAVRLNERLDVGPIRSLYARAGRVHIRPFLADECALAIHECLASQLAWQVHLNDGDRPINLSGSRFEDLPEEDLQRFRQSVYASAGGRFQYLYNSFPISDFYERGEQRELYLMRVHEFLNSPPFLGFARAVTGVPGIALADAQATRYRPGNFLTRHDDLVRGKKRVAAYVLGFTPRWSADWGGILQFIADDGHVAEGYVPAFNAMNIFRVPQLHAVSYVAPFARADRYSITGWLREQ
jgi:Rps23 Pro-64 3,4-dihydroxylase Tpa1-like proline 4-hydroxylase